MQALLTFGLLSSMSCLCSFMLRCRCTGFSATMASSISGFTSSWSRDTRFFQVAISGSADVLKGKGVQSGSIVSCQVSPRRCVQRESRTGVLHRTVCRSLYGCWKCMHETRCDDVRLPGRRVTPPAYLDFRNVSFSLGARDSSWSSCLLVTRPPPVLGEVLSAQLESISFTLLKRDVFCFVRASQCCDPSHGRLLVAPAALPLDADQHILHESRGARARTECVQ